MSNNFSEIDKRFKDELYDYTHEPEAKVWQQLEVRLQGQAARQKKSWAIGVLLFIGFALITSGFAAYKASTYASIQAKTNSKPGRVNINEHSLSPGSENSHPVNGDKIDKGKRTVDSVLQSSLINTQGNKNELIVLPQSLPNRRNHYYSEKSKAVAEQSYQADINKAQTPFFYDTPIQQNAFSTSLIKDDAIKPYSELSIEALPVLFGLLDAHDHAVKPLQLNAPFIKINNAPKMRLDKVSIIAGLGTGFRKLKDTADPLEGNKAYFNQYESKGAAWCSGLSLSFKKSRHWSVNTGMVYQSITMHTTQPLNAVYNASGQSEGIYTTSFNANTLSFLPKNTNGLSDGDLLSYAMNASQTTAQVSLPVDVSYTCYIGKLGIEMGAGMQVNHITHQMMTIDNSSNLFTNYTINSAESNSQWYWSTIGNVQLFYPITKQYNWSIGFHYDFANSSANFGKPVLYLPFNKYFTTGISKYF
jgi:hypothetical protein